MHVTIERFKSVRRLGLELGDVTVLVNPPAGGKTNVMEALATLGYAVKAAVESRLGEYPEPRLVPYYNELVRALSCDDLLWRYPPGAGIAVVRVGGTEVALSCPGDPSRLDLKLSAGGWNGPVGVRANLAPYGALAASSKLPPPRSALGHSDIEKIFNAIIYLASVFSDEARERMKPYSLAGAPGELRGTVPAPRLYGFDRLGALFYIMLGLTGSRYPYSYLDERGVNLATILHSNPRAREEVNRVVGRRVRPPGPAPC